MAKKTFKIRVRFSFGVWAKVQAKSREEAEAIFVGRLRAQLGRVEIMDDDIVDWETDIKGDTTVNRKQAEEE